MVTFFSNLKHFFLLFYNIAIDFFWRLVEVLSFNTVSSLWFFNYKSHSILYSYHFFSFLFIHFLLSVFRFLLFVLYSFFCFIVFTLPSLFFVLLFVIFKIKVTNFNTVSSIVELVYHYKVRFLELPGFLEFYFFWFFSIFFRYFYFFIHLISIFIYFVFFCIVRFPFWLFFCLVFFCFYILHSFFYYFLSLPIFSFFLPLYVLLVDFFSVILKVPYFFYSNFFFRFFSYFFNYISSFFILPSFIHLYVHNFLILFLPRGVIFFPLFGNFSISQNLIIECLQKSIGKFFFEPRILFTLFYVRPKYTGLFLIKVIKSLIYICGFLVVGSILSSVLHMELLTTTLKLFFSCLIFLTCTLEFRSFSTLLEYSHEYEEEESKEVEGDDTLNINHLAGRDWIQMYLLSSSDDDFHMESDDTQKLPEFTGAYNAGLFSKPLENFYNLSEFFSSYKVKRNFFGPLGKTNKRKFFAFYSDTFSFFFLISFLKEFSYLFIVLFTFQSTFVDRQVLLPLDRYPFEAEAVDFHDRKSMLFLTQMTLDHNTLSDVGMAYVAAPSMLANYMSIDKEEPSRMIWLYYAKLRHLVHGGTYLNQYVPPRSISPQAKTDRIFSKLVKDKPFTLNEKTMFRSLAHRLNLIREAVDWFEVAEEIPGDDLEEATEDLFELVQSNSVYKKFFYNYFYDKDVLPKDSSLLSYLTEEDLADIADVDEFSEFITPRHEPFFEFDYDKYPLTNYGVSKLKNQIGVPSSSERGMLFLKRKLTNRDMSLLLKGRVKKVNLENISGTLKFSPRTPSKRSINPDFDRAEFSFYDDESFKTNNNFFSYRFDYKYPFAKVGQVFFGDVPEEPWSIKLPAYLDPPSKKDRNSDYDPNQLLNYSVELKAMDPDWRWIFDSFDKRRFPSFYHRELDYQYNKKSKQVLKDFVFTDENFLSDDREPFFINSSLNFGFFREKLFQKYLTVQFESHFLKQKFLTSRDQYVYLKRFFYYYNKLIEQFGEIPFRQKNFFFLFGLTRGSNDMKHLKSISRNVFFNRSSNDFGHGYSGVVNNLAFIPKSKRFVYVPLLKGTKFSFRPTTRIVDNLGFRNSLSIAFLTRVSDFYRYNKEFFYLNTGKLFKNPSLSKDLDTRYNESYFFRIPLSHYIGFSEDLDLFSNNYTRTFYLDFFFHNQIFRSVYFKFSDAFYYALSFLVGMPREPDLKLIEYYGLIGNSNFVEDSKFLTSSRNVRFAIKQLGGGRTLFRSFLAEKGFLFNNSTSFWFSSKAPPKFKQAYNIMDWDSYVSYLRFNLLLALNPITVKKPSFFSHYVLDPWVYALRPVKFFFNDVFNIIDSGSNVSLPVKISVLKESFRNNFIFFSSFYKESFLKNYFFISNLGSKKKILLSDDISSRPFMFTEDLYYRSRFIDTKVLQPFVRFNLESQNSLVDKPVSYQSFTPLEISNLLNLKKKTISSLFLDWSSFFMLDHDYFYNLATFNRYRTRFFSELFASNFISDYRSFFYRFFIRDESNFYFEANKADVEFYSGPLSGYFHDRSSLVSLEDNAEKVGDLPTKDSLFNYSLPLFLSLFSNEKSFSSSSTYRRDLAYLLVGERERWFTFFSKGFMSDFLYHANTSDILPSIVIPGPLSFKGSQSFYVYKDFLESVLIASSSTPYPFFSQNFKIFDVDLLNLKNTSWFFWKTPLLRHSDVILSPYKVSILSSNNLLDRSKFYSNNHIVRFNISSDFWSSFVENSLLDRLKLTNISNSFFPNIHKNNFFLTFYRKISSLNFLKSSKDNEQDIKDYSTFSGPISDTDDNLNFLNNVSYPLNNKDIVEFSKEFISQKSELLKGRSYSGFSWFFRNFSIWDMRSFWSFIPSEFYIGFKDQDSIDPVYFFSFDKAASKFHNIVRPKTMNYVMDRFPNYIRKQDYWLNDVPTYFDSFLYIGHYIDKLKTLKTFNVDTPPEIRKKSTFISLLSDFERSSPEKMAKVIFGTVKPSKELSTSDYQYPKVSIFTEKYRRLLPSYFSHAEAVPYSVLDNSTLRYFLPDQTGKINNNKFAERFLYDDKTASIIRVMLSKLAVGYTDALDENVRGIYSEDPSYFNTIRPLRFFHFFGRRLINPGSFFADKPIGHDEIVPHYHFNYDTHLPKTQFARSVFHPQFYQMYNPLVYNNPSETDFYDFPGPFLDKDFDLIQSPYNHNLEVLSNRRLPFEDLEEYDFHKMKKKYPAINVENYMADCYSIAGKETRTMLTIDGPPLQRSLFFYRPGGPDSLRFLDKVQMVHYFHRAPFFDSPKQVFPVSPAGDTPGKAASYLYLTRLEKSYDFPFIKPSIDAKAVPNINKLPFAVWAFLSEIFREKSQAGQDKLLYMWDILVERRLRRAPRPIELYVNLPVGHYKRRFFAFSLEGFLADENDITEMSQATADLDVSQYPESGREELLAPMYDVFLYNNIFTATWFNFFSDAISLKTNLQLYLTDPYATTTVFDRDPSTDDMELHLHTYFSYSAIAPGSSILHFIENFLLNYVVIFLSASVDFFSTEVSPYTGRGVFYMVSNGFLTSFMIGIIAIISVFVSFMWYFQLEEWDEPDEEEEELTALNFEMDDEALFEKYVPTGDILVEEFLEQIRLANFSKNTFPLSKSFLVNVLETQDLYGDVLTRYDLQDVVMDEILGDDREFGHVIYNEEFPSPDEFDLSVLDQSEMVRGLSSYRFPPFSLFQLRHLRESQERFISNLEHLDAHSFHPHNLGFWSVLFSSDRRKKQGAYVFKGLGYDFSMGRDEEMDTFINSGQQFFSFNRLRRFYINPKNQFRMKHWSFRMSRPVEGHIKNVVSTMLKSYSRPWLSSTLTDLGWIFDNESLDPNYDFAFEDNEPTWHNLYDKSFMPPNELYTFFDRFFISLILNYQLLLRFPSNQWNVFIIDGGRSIWHIFSFFHRFFFVHIDLFGFGNNKEVFRFFFLHFFNGYNFNQFKSFLNFDLVGYYKKRNRLDFFYSNTFFPFRDPDKANSYFNHIILDDDIDFFNSAINYKESLENEIPLGVPQDAIDKYIKDGFIPPYLKVSDYTLSRQSLYDPVLTMYFNANHDAWADISYIYRSLIIPPFTIVPFALLTFKEHPTLDPRPSSFRFMEDVSRHYFYRSFSFRKLLNFRSSKPHYETISKQLRSGKIKHKYKVLSKPKPGLPVVFNGFPGSSLQRHGHGQPPVHYTDLIYYLLFSEGNESNTSVLDFKKVKYNNPFSFAEGYTFSNFYYTDELFSKPKSDLFVLSRPFVLLQAHEFLFNFYFGSHYLRLEFLKKFLMVEFRYRDRLSRSVNNLNFSTSLLLNNNFNSDFVKSSNASTSFFFKHFFYGTVRHNSSSFYHNGDSSFFSSSWLGFHWYKLLSKFYFNYRKYGRSFVDYSKVRDISFVQDSSLLVGSDIKNVSSPFLFSLGSNSNSHEIFDNHFFSDEAHNLHYSSFLFPFEDPKFLSPVNGNNKVFWDFYLFHSNFKLMNANSSSFKKPIETSYFTVYPLFNVFGLPLDLSSFNYNYDFFLPELFCNTLFENNVSSFKQFMMLDFIDHVISLRGDIVDSLDTKNLKKFSKNLRKEFPGVASKVISYNKSCTSLKNNFPFEKFENYKLFLYFILNQDFSYVNFVSILDSFPVSSFFYNPDSVLFQLTKPIHSNDIYNYSLLFTKEESSLERLFALKQRLYYEGSEQFLKANNINNLSIQEFFSDENKMDFLGEHDVSFENDLFFHFGNLDFDLDNNASVYFGGNPHVWFYYKFLLDNMPTRFRSKDADNFDAFVSDSKLFNFSFSSYDSNWFLDLMNLRNFKEISFDRDIKKNFRALFDSTIKTSWWTHFYNMEDTAYNNYVRKIWFYKKRKKLWAGLKKQHLRVPNILVEDFNLSNPITSQSFNKYGDGLDFFNTSFSRDISKKISLLWNNKLLIKPRKLLTAYDRNWGRKRRIALAKSRKKKGLKYKSRSKFVFKRKAGLLLSDEMMSAFPHTNDSWFFQSLYNRRLIDGFENNKGNLGYGTYYSWVKSSNYFYNLSHFSLEGRSSEFSVINNSFTQRPASSIFYTVQPLNNSLDFSPALKFKKPKFQVRQFLKKYRSSLGFSSSVLAGLSLLPFSNYFFSAIDNNSFYILFHQTSSFVKFIEREILSFVRASSSSSNSSVKEQNQSIFFSHDQLHHGPTVLRSSSSDIFVNPIFEESSDWFAADSNSLFFVDLWIEQDYHEFLVHLHLDSSLKKDRQLDFFSLQFERLFFKRKLANITFSNYLYSNNVFDRMDLDFDYFVQYFFTNGVFPEFLEMRFINFLLYSFSKDMQFLLNLVYAGFDLTSFGDIFDHGEGFTISDRPSNLIHSSELDVLPRISFTSPFNDKFAPFDFRVPFSACFSHLSPLVSNLFNPLPGDWSGNYDFVPFFLTNPHQSWSLDANRVSNFMLNFHSNSNFVNSWGLLSSFENLERIDLGDISPKFSSVFRQNFFSNFTTRFPFSSFVHDSEILFSGAGDVDAVLYENLVYNFFGSEAVKSIKNFKSKNMRSGQQALDWYRLRQESSFVALSDEALCFHILRLHFLNFKFFFHNDLSLDSLSSRSNSFSSYFPISKSSIHYLFNERLFFSSFYDIFKFNLFLITDSFNLDFIYSVYWSFLNERFIFFFQLFYFPITPSLFYKNINFFFYSNFINMPIFHDFKKFISLFDKKEFGFLLPFFLLVPRYQRYTFFFDFYNLFSYLFFFCFSLFLILRVHFFWFYLFFEIIYIGF